MDLKQGDSGSEDKEKWIERKESDMRIRRTGLK